ncbi:MAG: hypothetical protein ACOWWO_19110 [Peptococcaceae bacterium]
MLKNMALFSFIAAIICYVPIIFLPFFGTGAWTWHLTRIALGLFAVGVVTGLIHVIAERREEKQKEDWDKMKDY